MAREGQRIGRLMTMCYLNSYLMCYLTPRVVSPPRPSLVVASFRRIPAHSYNKTYTQNITIKPEPWLSCPCKRRYSIARGLVCIGYPIPCLGKGSAPLSLASSQKKMLGVGSGASPPLRLLKPDSHRAFKLSKLQTGQIYVADNFAVMHCRVSRRTRSAASRASTNYVTTTTVRTTVRRIRSLPADSSSPTTRFF
jgi:hypothetical protein